MMIFRVFTNSQNVYQQPDNKESRTLNPDMLCRNSKEPDCSGGLLPDASIGQSPGTLARK
jgi:hypothetical protein